jgi:hypothetical protein
MLTGHKVALIFLNLAMHPFETVAAGTCVSVDKIDAHSAVLTGIGIALVSFCFANAALET